MFSQWKIQKINFQVALKTLIDRYMAIEIDSLDRMLVNIFFLNFDFFTGFQTLSRRTTSKAESHPCMPFITMMEFQTPNFRMYCILLFLERRWLKCWYSAIKLCKLSWFLPRADLPPRSCKCHSFLDLPGGTIN